MKLISNIEKSFKRFVSTRARRASDNARPARAATHGDRRGLAECCEVHRQSPAPPAPRLFACPQSWSHRRSPASFRPRNLRACERTSHPGRRGWSTFARKSALSPARSCFRIVAQREALRNVSSTGAELRAKMFLQGGNNFRGSVTDLRIGQRRFAALKRNAHEQRIFSGRNIRATKKIRSFD